MKQVLNWFFPGKNCGRSRQYRLIRGFTLIELMIVLVVLGTLMTVLFVSLGDSGIDEQQARIKMLASKSHIEIALFKFKSAYGRFPTEEEGLDVLIQPSADTSNYPANGFLSKPEMINDPWNNPYRYQISEDTGQYAITSLGSDAREGGTGTAADVDLNSVK